MQNTPESIDAIASVIRKDGEMQSSDAVAIAIEEQSADKPTQDGSVMLKNPRWELFCQLYISSNNLGNGTEAYIEAYDVDEKQKGARARASSSAGQLLNKPLILARINYLVENLLGFSDTYVDKELAFIIAQKSDLKSKLGAIKEYNLLKGRVKRKLELSFANESEAELDALLAETEQQIKLGEELAKARSGAASKLPRGMPALTPEQQMVYDSQASPIPALITKETEQNA